MEMKARILIVDDEKDFTESLAERLSLRDYGVNTASSGEEALEKIKAYNLDVVILDLQMPGLDGIETLREIKEIKPLTEVIMLTAHATVETAIKGLQLGAVDYLMKPCDSEELVAKIDMGYERKADQEERIRWTRVANISSTFSADVPL
jgi:DNA-binding response OmpR family regulator